MNRRKFLESVCLAGGGIAIAGSIADFSKTAKAFAGTPGRTKDVSEIPINLIDNPELKPVGGTYHLELDDSGQNILVVHVTQDKFVAVDLKCTYCACDVSYKADAKKFYCPCHGSEFDLYGRNLKGPATKPLNYYHAELKGDEVNVTVYAPGDPVPPNSIPPPDTSNRGMAIDSSSVNSSPADSIYRTQSDSARKQ